MNAKQFFTPREKSNDFFIAYNNRKNTIADVFAAYDTPIQYLMPDQMPEFVNPCVRNDIAKSDQYYNYVLNRLKLLVSIGVPTETEIRKIWPFILHFEEWLKLNPWGLLS